jgi:hypothetical protein
MPAVLDPAAILAASALLARRRHAARPARRRVTPLRALDPAVLEGPASPGTLAGCDDAGLPICAAEWRPELADDDLGVLRRRLSLFHSSVAGWPAIARAPAPAATAEAPLSYPPGFDPAVLPPYFARPARLRPRRRPPLRPRSPRAARHVGPSPFLPGGP